WIVDTLAPVFPHADDMESTLIGGVGGGPAPPQAATGPRPPVGTQILWEGQRYVLDIGASERRRLQRIRERQGGPSVDVALSLASEAQTLSNADIDVDTIRASVANLKTLVAGLAPRSRRADADSRLDPAAGARTIIEKAIEELSKITRARDAKRAT